MKKNLEKIESLIIYVLITYMTFQGLFVTFNYIDELIIISLIIINFMINRKKINKIKITLLIIYSAITFITIIIRKYYIDAYIIDYINTLKPFLLIETLSNIKINKKRINYYIKYLIFLNIISIIYGFYNYYLVNSGTYIIGYYRQNVYRIQGFSGHPANLATLSLFTIIYEIKNIKSKKVKKTILSIVIILINLIAIYYTQSRVQLMATIMYIIYIFFYQNAKYKIIKVIIWLFLICIIGIIIININSIMSYYQVDLDNAIRFYAISKIPEVLNRYPILGTGIGSFSTKESITNYSYVYSEFNFSQSIINVASIRSVSLFESNIAKQTIQTGMLGTIIYYLYFVIIYKENKKSNEIAFWILFIVANSMLNLMYAIQLLIPLGLLIAENMMKEE